MRKFILISIFKTWLFSTVISIFFLYLYLNSIRKPEEQYRHMCDMSGLAYGLIIIWLLFLSLFSFSALLSCRKTFQKSASKFLCWFLLPFLFCIVFFIAFSEGGFDKENIILSLISCLPWFSFWGFYYYQFNKKFKSDENV